MLGWQECLKLAQSHLKINFDCPRILKFVTNRKVDNIVLENLYMDCKVSHRFAEVSILQK